MIVDNMITRSDFEKSLKLNGLESFNSDQVSAWLNDNKKLIEKSKVEELDELEKSALDEFKVNAGSLKKVIVVEDNLEKSIVFVRPQQVDWDKDENGEILKSRAGTYKDTPENRKLGRVGQKFGSKKDVEGKESDNKEPKPKSSSNEDMSQYHREMMDYHNKRGEGHLYHRHMAKRDEYKHLEKKEENDSKKYSDDEISTFNEIREWSGDKYKNEHIDSIISQLKEADITNSDLRVSIAKNGGQYSFENNVNKKVEEIFKELRPGMEHSDLKEGDIKSILWGLIKVRN